LWSSDILWLLAALLAQGGLALGIALYLGFVRVPLVVRGEVHLRDVALSRNAWPEREKQVSNAFDNQFQLPLLLYVAVFAALYLGPSLLEVLLAWLFVASRYVHACIHLTNNHVIRRFAAYTAGLVVICILWLDLLVRLLLTATGVA
jgi:hypothetical protein